MAGGSSPEVSFKSETPSSGKAPCVVKLTKASPRTTGLVDALIVEIERRLDARAD